MSRIQFFRVRHSSEIEFFPFLHVTYSCYLSQHLSFLCLSAAKIVFHLFPLRLNTSPLTSLASASHVSLITARVSNLHRFYIGFTRVYLFFYGYWRHLTLADKISGLRQRNLRYCIEFLTEVSFCNRNWYY